MNNWRPYYPANMNKIISYSNLRLFQDYARDHNLLVMEAPWGSVAMKDDGKIVAYFTRPEPIHLFKETKV